MSFSVNPSTNSSASIAFAKSGIPSDELEPKSNPLSPSTESAPASRVQAASTHRLKRKEPPSLASSNCLSTRRFKVSSSQSTDPSTHFTSPTFDTPNSSSQIVRESPSLSEGRKETIDTLMALEKDVTTWFKQIRIRIKARNIAEEEIGEETWDARFTQIYNSHAKTFGLLTLKTWRLFEVSQDRNSSEEETWDARFTQINNSYAKTFCLLPLNTSHLFEVMNLWGKMALSVLMKDQAKFDQLYKNLEKIRTSKNEVPDSIENFFLAARKVPCLKTIQKRDIIKNFLEIARRLQIGFEKSVSQSMLRVFSEQGESKSDS